MNVSLQVERIPDGPTHVLSETINGVNWQLTIAVQNNPLRKIFAPPEAGISGSAFPLVVNVGGALADHDPLLAMGAGGLTLVVAAVYTKDWCWWLVGISHPGPQRVCRIG